MVFIESQDFSGTATLDFTGFDATKYDGYVFEIANMTPNNDATIQLSLSTDGGSTWNQFAPNYQYQLSEYEFTASPTPEHSGSASGNPILTQKIVESTGPGFSARLFVHGPHLANSTYITWAGAYYRDTGVYRRVEGAIVFAPTDPVDGIRFSSTNPTMASGTITMYGLRNS